jgi:hypothetical protein
MPPSCEAREPRAGDLDSGKRGMLHRASSLIRSATVMAIYRLTNLTSRLSTAFRADLQKSALPVRKVPRFKPLSNRSPCKATQQLMHVPVVGQPGKQSFQASGRCTRSTGIRTLIRAYRHGLSVCRWLCAVR